MVKFSVLTYVIELNERNQPLFTELKKLGLVSRYVVSNVAKICLFHTLANFKMQFVENHYLFSKAFSRAKIAPDL